jgi:histidyl-tRNA synthetase
MAAPPTHRFQAPKGTRDFLPGDMAVRRHVERAWRDAAIRHGFDEIDGPTFEHLDLYTVKSGPGIVSELFSFRRAGGDTDYALRPEFTPTLARMVAGMGASLPRPVKWFSIGSMFRAERPQRGRLREHVQWNVDLLGEASREADAEVVAVAADLLERLGLRPTDAQIKLNDRGAITRLLESLGLPVEATPAALALLDRRDKMEDAAFRAEAAMLGMSASAVAKFLDLSTQRVALGAEEAAPSAVREALLEGEESRTLTRALRARGLQPWCHWDLGIVRGLAYYTGTVFEVHETTGRERAIAGGGRYDELVELFGGAPTPAVGFAMGDVVIRLALEERGLLRSPEEYLPRPDVFVIEGRSEDDGRLPAIVAQLRRGGLHVRHSYRATRNIGKLLGDASKARARLAVILGREMERDAVVVRDLEAGAQEEVALADIVSALRAKLG